MPKVSERAILDDAMKKRYAVSAFAINNMEQIEGITRAARLCRSPLIIMVSKNSLKYSRHLLYLMEAAVKENPDIPIALHLDHGENFAQCKEAIDFGLTSVMVDGSFDQEGKASSYDYNIKLTKKVADYAHNFGVSVEGEIGVIGGKEENIDIEENQFTDPGMVKEFVNYTGIDSLAVSIGNKHGLNKFDGKQELRFDILEKIHQEIPSTPLVLHGASSLPQEYIQDIEKYGGIMNDTLGVPIDQIKDAIALGVRKVNIYTDIILCMIATIRKMLIEKPQVIDPRQYLGSCRDEITRLAMEKIKAFGSRNRF